MHLFFFMPKPHFVLHWTNNKFGLQRSHVSKVPKPICGKTVQTFDAATGCLGPDCLGDPVPRRLSASDRVPR